MIDKNWPPLLTVIFFVFVINSCYTYMDYNKITKKRTQDPAQVDWTMPGGSFLRYNFTSEEPQFPIQRKFRAKHESIVVDQPLLNKSVLQLMLASGKTFFYTFDSLKYVGEQKPTFGMEHAGLIQNEESFYPNVLGNFSVKAMQFGREISEKAYGKFPVDGGILVKDNSLLFAEKGIFLTSVFLNTYQPKWSLKLHDKMLSNPVLSGDSLYVTDMSGYIYALDWSSGTLLWETQINATVSNNPVVFKNKIYVFSKTGLWVMLEKKTGQIQWQSSGNPSIVAPPAYNGKNIYLAALDHRLYCFNPITHSTDWHFDTDGVLTSQPFCAGPYIIFGSWDKKLYILDHAGNSVYTDTLNKPIKSSPLFINGKLYVNASNFGTYLYE